MKQQIQLFFIFLLLFFSCKKDTDPTPIPIPDPTFAVSATNIDLGKIEASTKSTLKLTKNGTGIIAYTISSDKPWLVLSKATGTLDVTETIDLSVDVATLINGDNTATLTIVPKINNVEKPSIAVSVKGNYTKIIPDLPFVKQWDKSFGGTDKDYITYLSVTQDGGFLVTGFSASDKSVDKSENTNGAFDYWVVKTDANGTKQWDRSLGGSFDDLIYATVPIADGGTLLVGYSQSGSYNEKSEGNRGIGYDYWIMKIDAKGKKVWDKTIGGNHSDLLYAAATTADGGFILAGYSQSNQSGEKTENSKGGNDYWIVKVDANGIKQWDKTIGGAGDDVLRSMVATADGGFILEGQSNSNQSGDKSENSRGGYDYWIVKVNANGVKQWDKTFGGNKDETIGAVVETPDGGLLIGGGSASDLSGEKSEAAKGVSDYWVIKIDANGVKQWDKTYGGNGDSFLRSVMPTTNGNFILAGRTTAGKSGDKSEVSLGGIDNWLVKINAKGEKIWDKAFGGSDNDVLNAAVPTPDGGFLLGSWANSNQSGDKSENSRGDYDYWIIKVK